MDRKTAKKYQLEKLIVTFSGMVLSLFFWLIVIISPLGRIFAGWAGSVFNNGYLQFYLFCSFLALSWMLLNLPLSYISGFRLEHRYHLSNQSVNDWIREMLKGLLVGLVLGGVILGILFLFLKQFPSTWWLWSWLFLFVFSILLSRLAPVLLFPLFYKFTPLQNDSLQADLQDFARKWGLEISGIF
ncbi:MAG: hypothetical protein WAN36_16270, partial [Calditrichia bacterium]